MHKYYWICLWINNFMECYMHWSPDRKQMAFSNWVIGKWLPERLFTKMEEGLATTGASAFPSGQEDGPATIHGSESRKKRSSSGMRRQRRKTNPSPLFSSLPQTSWRCYPTTKPNRKPEGMEAHWDSPQKSFPWAERREGGDVWLWSQWKSSSSESSLTQKCMLLQKMD